MQSGIVQKIFQDHYPDYQRRNKLHSRQSRAAWSIMTCRTADQGYHIDVCPKGDYQVTVLNSCKHRACPQCGGCETELWLQRRKAQALDCRYFQVVFTIDHSLQVIWRYNRKLFTGLMMRAAWHSLRELLLDWRHMGGLAGAVAAFQSWDDELGEHCHVHFIVTAGGVNADGRWVEAGDILLPTQVLAAKFRGKFRSYLSDGFNRYTPTGKQKHADHVLKVSDGMRLQQCLNLLNKSGRKRWHADIEPAYEHANGVFKYVGRYLRRGPISERRIVGYHGNTVTIAYAHQDKHENRTFSLPVELFIKRMLIHVPEKGTHVVRSYGLFHPNCREKLNHARKHLGQQPYVAQTGLPDVIELLTRMFPDQQIGRCPKCGAKLVTVFVCRGGQPPVWRLAA